MSRFLAIDADANGLYVVAATARKGTVTADLVAAHPDPAPLSPPTAAAVGAKLKALLASAKIKPAPVLLCVGRDRVIPKEIKHPPVPPAEEPALVRFQAMKELTEAPEDVVTDYLPLPTVGGERRAQVVFARKDVLLAAKILCESAGLKLAGVTPRPFAVAAAWRKSGANPGGAPVAIVSVGPAGGEFTVVTGTDVGFTRAIPVAAVLDETALIAELRRNLTVAGMGGRPVSAIAVAESAESDLNDRLADALDLPVTRFDPLANVPAGANTPAAARGSFAGPLGLLALAATGDPLPINFAQPRQPRAAADPNRTRILVGAGLAVAVLGLGGLFGLLELEKAGRRLSTASNRRDDLDSQLKLLEVQSKTLAAADEFTNREIVWLDEMYDLADRFPDVKRARVLEIEATPLAPPPIAKGAAAAKGPPKPNPAAKLRIVVATEEPALVDRFVDGLNQDKYYLGTSKTTGGLTSGSSKAQQFTVTTSVLHRPPTEYKRKLVAPPPPKPEPEPVPEEPKETAVKAEPAEEVQP